MNTSLQAMMKKPLGIGPSGLCFEENEQKTRENKQDIPDVTYLTPLAGTFLAHNTTQSFLLGRAVAYFSNPVTNYFLNLPIAAAAGSLAFLVSKWGLSEPQKENAPTNLEGVTKSIGWSTVFTTIGSMGLHKAIVENATVDVVSQTVLVVAQNILGTMVLEVGFVVASTCLSLALLSFAEEILKEESIKDKNLKRV